MSTVVATIGLLIGSLIITIINPFSHRSIGGRSRNYRGFDIGRLLLLRLVVVVGVIDDDYLAVTRRSTMSRLRSSKSFLVNSSSREVSTTSEEGPLTGVVPEALPCSNIGEQRRRGKTSDGDFPLQKESAHT
jgi:hypothetical protein